MACRLIVSKICSMHISADGHVALGRPITSDYIARQLEFGPVYGRLLHSLLNHSPNDGTVSGLWKKAQIPHVNPQSIATYPESVQV